MVDVWKIILGIVLVLVGLAVLWHGYTVISGCNSIYGKIATAITSIFGGQGAQNCYNAQLQEIAGILVALIGVVVIFAGNNGKHKK
jgi:hypothetical protein